MLQYLVKFVLYTFQNTGVTSYDKAANMSGHYKEMQQKKKLYSNKFAIYVPYVVHSLNLVGQSAVDCCQEAVNFFSTVQFLYTFFLDPTSQ